MYITIREGAWPHIVMFLAGWHCCGDLGAGSTSYIYTYIYIYIYIHTHTYTQTYIYIYIHIYIHTYTHTHIHTYTHYIYIYIYMNTYVYIHAYSFCSYLSAGTRHGRHRRTRSSRVPARLSGDMFRVYAQSPC